MSAVGDARKRTEAAQSSPGAGEVEAARASRSLNLTVQDALVHRLKWASLHWRTADVNSEAWPHLADAVADHVLASDWLAQHDADLIARVEAKAREGALREAADEWTQGAWSNVMLPKPMPPAVPVIAYSNRMGDWLRDRADEQADALDTAARDNA